MIVECEWGGIPIQAYGQVLGYEKSISSVKRDARWLERCRAGGAPLMKIIPFADLETSDLLLDATYLGGTDGHLGDDPLPRLLGLSNQGGFRFLGSLDGNLRLVCMTTTLGDADWPDEMNLETGVFTYYGDNKKPGQELHKTGRGGNRILKSLFDAIHAGSPQRELIPPVFLFLKTGSRRDVRFLGLAVPGVTTLAQTEDLVAVWKTSGNRRFQNYRARFTVLDIPTISRAWISSIATGKRDDELAPAAWKTWVKTGRRIPLISQRSIAHRRRVEQMPAHRHEIELLNILTAHFQSDSYVFEHFAAAVAQMMIPSITNMDVTRRSRDGGRDAVGKMRIGEGDSSIEVDFAMEAKCYGPRSSVGVRELARLISRLRHRQFGILVTTAWVDLQAYKEIKDDQHPIVIIAGGDITRILIRSGYSDPLALSSWLSANFPRASDMPQRREEKLSPKSPGDA